MTGRSIRAATIAGRPVGGGARPLVVAELSANHNGTLEHALAIMRAAKAAGADAIKLQTYTADTITIDHDGPGFRIEGGLWHGRTLHDLYQEAHTPWEWHERLFHEGRTLDLPVFSTPFDESAIDFLERFDPPAYKIASFELVDLGLIRAVAKRGRPMILSTGMASLDEISEGVSAARDAGASDIVLLHCTSGYPTPAEEANIRTLAHLSSTFGVPVGLSDHTLGIGVAIASVAMGAALIEKHVTLRRSDGGPDAAFSLEPDELKVLVDNVRLAHASLGQVTYDRRASEIGNIGLRRSLYVVRDLRAGEVLTGDSLRSIRPGFGLHPRYRDMLIGKAVIRDVPRGTPMSWDLVEE